MSAEFAFPLCATNHLFKCTVAIKGNASAVMRRFAMIAIHKCQASVILLIRNKTRPKMGKHHLSVRETPHVSIRLPTNGSNGAQTNVAHAQKNERRVLEIWKLAIHESTNGATPKECPGDDASKTTAERAREM